MLITDDIKREIINGFELDAMTGFNGYCVVDYRNKNNIDILCKQVFEWLSECGFKDVKVTPHTSCDRFYVEGSWKDNPQNCSIEYNKLHKISSCCNI